MTDEGAEINLDRNIVTRKAKAKSRNVGICHAKICRNARPALVKRGGGTIVLSVVPSSPLYSVLVA